MTAFYTDMDKHLAPMLLRQLIDGGERTPRFLIEWEDDTDDEEEEEETDEGYETDLTEWSGL